MKWISAALAKSAMPKTAISGTKCGQIRTRRSRKQKASGFLGNSDVKKIPNAFALHEVMSGIANRPDWSYN